MVCLACTSCLEVCGSSIHATISATQHVKSLQAIFCTSSIFRIDKVELHRSMRYGVAGAGGVITPAAFLDWF